MSQSAVFAPGITALASGVGAAYHRLSLLDVKENPMRFFLGTHQPCWLRRTDVPLFVSDRTLRRYRRLPYAHGPWALDSGGFTELSTHGSWRNGPTPRQYVNRVRRYRDNIGHLAWAAPQDWMCEPFITGITGLTVAEHQRRTVDNFCELRALDDDLPFIPVLQGYRLDDYLTCIDLYRQAGIDLTTYPVVGLGSVCRRQATTEIAHIINAIRDAGITHLHGFGVKTAGLRRYGHHLISSDSLAWSYAARRDNPLPGCTTHKNCANCMRYAHQWRTQLLTTLAGSYQLDLFHTAGTHR
jgi:hypothetical protein